MKPIDKLPVAMAAAFERLKSRDDVFDGCSLLAPAHNGDGALWRVLDCDQEVARWRSEQFPSASNLVVTSKSFVRPDSRGRGIGSALYRMRLEAYRDAGFAAALCTVHEENSAQQAVMDSAGGTFVFAPVCRRIPSLRRPGTSYTLYMIVLGAVEVFSLNAHE